MKQTGHCGCPKHWFDSLHYIWCSPNPNGLIQMKLHKKSPILISFPFTLFEKSTFCPKIQFWQNPQHFHEFFTQIFLAIFLVKSKLSTAKKSKTTTFSRVFHPIFFFDIFFLVKSKLNFWTKNEDSEQCEKAKGPFQSSEKRQLRPVAKQSSSLLLLV